MQEKKKITVREGGWGDYELLRAAIREEQHIHAVNRPDIFADLEDSPFGREDFEMGGDYYAICQNCRFKGRHAPGKAYLQQDGCPSL